MQLSPEERIAFLVLLTLLTGIWTVQVQTHGMPRPTLPEPRWEQLANLVACDAENPDTGCHFSTSIVP